MRGPDAYTEFVRRWFPVLMSEDGGLRAFFLKGLLVASTSARGLATLSVENKVACYNAHASDAVQQAVMSTRPLANDEFARVLKCAKLQLDGGRDARPADSETAFRAFVQFVRSNQVRQRDRNAALAAAMLVAEERGFANFSDEKRERARLRSREAESTLCKQIQAALPRMENGHVVEIVSMLKDAAEAEVRRAEEARRLRLAEEARRREVQRLADEALATFLERELPLTALGGLDEPVFSF